MTDQESQQMQERNDATEKSIRKNLRAEDDKDSDLAAFLDTKPTQQHLAIRLKLYSESLQEEWEAKMTKMQKESDDNKKSREKRDQEGTILYRKLKSTSGDALTYTTRMVKEGDRKKTIYLTDPMEVDREVRRKWDEAVYNGCDKNPRS